MAVEGRDRLSLRRGPPAITPSETRLVWLIAAIQLVNVLDFMMVVPLGPDFAADLHIDPSHLGFIAGAYTAAAAVAGIIGSWWFDHLERRRLLLLALLGLSLSTMAGALAVDLPTLIAARALAGAFGGPVTSLSLSALTDGVAADRRGRALGLVMSAFAVASVFGVPAGLELAALGSWRTPFLGVGALCLAVSALAWLTLPPAPATQDVDARSTFRLMRDPSVLLALTATAAALTAHFAVVANISTWLQFNAGWPRERLGLLYLAGGLASFAILQVSGRLVDRFGAATVVSGGSLLLFVVFAVGFLPEPPILHPAWIFVGMMIGASVRNVALNALATRVPGPQERGRFMSLQSTVQHVAASVGAFGASLLLSARPDGGLVGMGQVTAVSLVLIAVVPLIIGRLSARMEAAGRV